MQVKKLYARVASHIFTWAGEEPLVIEYGGERFVVPPRNETAKLSPGGIYSRESARDAKGNLIPGTVVVSDMMVSGEQGPRRGLRIEDVCDWLASSREDLFNRGFNIVSTIQEVEEAIQAGIPLWEASQDEQARNTLANELARRKKYEEKGEPAPPASNERRVAWAIAHLHKRRVSQVPAIATEDLVGALQGRYVAPAPAATPAAAAPSAPTVIPDRASEIYEEADELGVNLSRAELAGLLKGDPEQTNFVLEKIKIKREALGQKSA